MVTNYVLYIHGVSVREATPSKPTYANKMIDRINSRLAGTSDVVHLPVYWGNANDEPLNHFKESLEASTMWEKMWFKSFREGFLLPFSADALLYLSRHFSLNALQQIANQIEVIFDKLNYRDGKKDRLHIVCHSWGTVILFDLLFAKRWDEQSVPGHELIKRIRNSVFGLRPHKSEGLWLSNIYTMGSPIALLSLLSYVGRDNPGSSHDVSVGFRTMLDSFKGRAMKMKWVNFVNPGDPFAWPLEGLLPDLIGENYQDQVSIEDKEVTTGGLLERLLYLVKGTPLGLLNSAEAHTYYWEDRFLADWIASDLAKY